MATRTQARGAANVVRLRGRLAAAPEARTLPSGDEVLTFRLIVDREPSRGSSVTVDTIDCTAWSAGTRRRVAAWEPGQPVLVEGALRRRFWRSAKGTRSRYDVEVRHARRAPTD